MSEEYLTIHIPNPASEISKEKRKSSTTTYQKYDPIHSMYQQFIKEIDKIKNSILKDSLNLLNKQTLDYFSDYYYRRLEAQQTIFENDNDDEDDLSLSSVFSIIPTITLFTGINVKDYSNLCENLSDNLRGSFTKYLFTINETNCQNIKNLLQSLFAQFKAIHHGSDGFTNRNLNTFRNLFDLIKDNDDTNTNAVVFVFKQFELIPKETIENFISVVSCYIEKVSIFFLIEMSSQSNILYEQLSGNLISKLCIKKLYSITPNKFMDKFLTNIFINNNNNTFKLSGNILKYLFDSYNSYNFSISHFIHSLNYCLYDHLMKNKLNCLFIFNHKSNRDDYEALLDEIESDESFKETFNKAKNLKDQIELAQKSWTKYHNQFSMICKFIYEIQRHFPCDNNEDKCLTNSSFSSLYIQLSNLININNKIFTDTEQFQNLKRLLYVASSDTLNEIVNNFINIINNITKESFSYDKEFIQDLSKLLDILKAIRSPIDFDDCDNDENKNDVSPVKRRMSIRKSLAIGLTDTSNLASNELTTPTKTTNSFRKRKTLSTVSANSFTNVRNKFIDWLTNQCSIYFDQDYAKDLSHSKYFCYSNIDCLKERLFQVQRTSIHDALVNPFKKYLTHNDCDTSDAPVLTNVYKIYLECGQMINLYDWLQAFVEKMKNSDLNDLSDEKKKLMQALFFRSITELQFMGFIKQTNRKVDHVVKLTNIGYNPE